MSNCHITNKIIFKQETGAKRRFFQLVWIPEIPNSKQSYLQRNISNLMMASSRYGCYSRWVIQSMEIGVKAILSKHSLISAYHSLFTIPCSWIDLGLIWCLVFYDIKFDFYANLKKIRMIVSAGSSTVYAPTLFMTLFTTFFTTYFFQFCTTGPSL